jgi:hypothetical protein
VVFGAVDPTRPLLFHNNLAGENQTLCSDSVIAPGYGSFCALDFNSRLITAPLSVGDANAIVAAMKSRIGI